MNDLKFNITELSVEQINLLLTALQEVAAPAKLTNPLTQQIKTQAENQLAAFQQAQLAKTETSE